MADFVLVHGAWHGGWCWSRVAARLLAAGHRVWTPTLTGVGERAHLAHSGIDLESHIADVLGVINAEELDGIVLCGHSYGGMVVTGVADRAAGRVRSLVYLDAFVPEDGQSLLSLQPAERQARMREAAAKGDGWRLAPFPAAHFNVRAAADRDWVDRRCVPQPLQTFTQPLRSTAAWQTVGTLTYIVAADYPNSPFGRFAERAKADPRWRFRSVACGHDVMVDEPARLAELLIEAAA